MTKILLIDVEKCTGCYSCVTTCSLVHEGVFSLNKSRIRLLKLEEKCLSIPLICEQCEESPCIEACPVNAIFRDSNGLVKINRDICTGCASCVQVCPYHGIRMIENKASICDLCNGDPACVRVCIPTKAIQFVDDTVENRRRKRELMSKKMDLFNKYFKDYEIV